jgi:hypothetical protein
VLLSELLLQSHAHQYFRSMPKLCKTATTVTVYACDAPSQLHTERACSDKHKLSGVLQLCSHDVGTICYDARCGAAFVP